MVLDSKMIIYLVPVAKAINHFGLLDIFAKLVTEEQDRFPFESGSSYGFRLTSQGLFFASAAWISE